MSNRKTTKHNATATRIVAAFRKCGLDDQDFPGWHQWTHIINQVSYQRRLRIDVEWLTTETDGFVQVAYWSEKIGRAIVLETVDRWREENLQQLAERLVSWNETALKLEARLPKVKREY